MTAARPEPLEIRVPEEDLADLRERLERARFPDDFANEDWRYGTPTRYLRELVAYWLEKYDWRAHEAAMNAFSHYRVTLDEVPIHYLHAPGVGPDPLPLVLTHGWPWTFWDYAELIRPLSDPGAHGGDPADAFDVVVPSLPGYGFSSPLRRTGVTWTTVSDLWVKLLCDVLGHPRFFAQGGDWGALVTAELGHRHAERLRGIHVTLPGHPCFGIGQMTGEDFAEDEQELFRAAATRAASATAHVAVHRSDPQTLAAAFEDSPLGLAAWIVERRRAWSDCDGDVEKRFSKDDLITTVMLYWLTRTAGTAMRFYWENLNLANPWQPSHDRTPAIEAPTGVAVFPKELIVIPRKLAERNAHLVHWSVMSSGGHFAPAEEPAALVEDIRTCFRPLRGS